KLEEQGGPFTLALRRVAEGSCLRGEPCQQKKCARTLIKLSSKLTRVPCLLGRFLQQRQRKRFNKRVVQKPGNTCLILLKVTTRENHRYLRTLRMRTWRASLWRRVDELSLALK